MVSMSLPHFSEESGSPHFLQKHHHKRVEAEDLFTLAHNRALLAFRIKGKLLVLADSGHLRPHIAPREWGSLLVQGNTHERTVDVDLAIVLEETKLPEFVHEEIDSRTCRANHLR
jgi:hypothetical protein